MYSIYSPGIKKARQLTGSNRPDGILRTQFSPDDIFGWSGKGNLVEGELGTKLTVLAPFLSDEVVVPTRKGGCAEVKHKDLEKKVRQLGGMFPVAASLKQLRGFPQMQCLFPAKYTESSLSQRTLIRSMGGRYFMWMQ